MAFCTNCGAAHAEDARFCVNCGALRAEGIAVAVVPPGPAINPIPNPATAGTIASVPTASAQSGTPLIALTAIGALLGAIIGYLTRPSAMFVGQLPLQAVISAGSSLSGMDQLLVPVAQQSFNQLLVGTIIGGVVGAVIAVFLRRSRAN